jgi:hypothetical protein
LAFGTRRRASPVDEALRLGMVVGPQNRRAAARLASRDGRSSPSRSETRLAAESVLVRDTITRKSFIRVAGAAAAALSLFLACPALVRAGQDRSSTAASDNRNQIEKTGDTVGDAAKKGGKAAGDAADTAANKASEAGRETGRAVERAGDKAGAAAGDAKANASRTKSKTRDKARRARKDAANAAGKAADSTGDAAGEAGAKAREAVQ